MMGDRRQDPEAGLLLYLRDGSLTNIPANYANKRGTVNPLLCDRSDESSPFYVTTLRLPPLRDYLSLVLELCIKSADWSSDERDHPLMWPLLSPQRGGYIRWGPLYKYSQHFCDIYAGLSMKMKKETILDLGRFKNKEKWTKIMICSHINWLSLGLIQLRNELAYYLKSSTEKQENYSRDSPKFHSLPRPINNERTCGWCPHTLNCAAYQRWEK